MPGCTVIDTDGVPIKAWTSGVPVEETAAQQLRNVAALPFVHPHIAAMPDVHWGIGATVGSVIPTRGAIIPAAVGVDIGCGMMAVQTTLAADRLSGSLAALRSDIEEAVPHGRTGHGDHRHDRGAWRDIPEDVAAAWTRRRGRRPSIETGLARIVGKHPRLARANSLHYLGTLGTGNHFIEVCTDETDRVWAMLHSGSRGIGNAIDSHFIALAKKEMNRRAIALPDANLAYLTEGTDAFDDYVEAVHWAQAFAAVNREMMMKRSSYVGLSSLLHDRGCWARGPAKAFGGTRRMAGGRAQDDGGSHSDTRVGYRRTVNPSRAASCLPSGVDIVGHSGPSRVPSGLRLRRCASVTVGSGQSISFGVLRGVVSRRIRGFRRVARAGRWPR